MPQPLNSKDNSLFRQVVRNYESKQYKKGLKAAEQVLRKNPNHGDTQAMKALILSSQGQLEEAFALAKIALKNDMKSHVCWHVYGLLYRAEKNYDEAIKAYKFALKLDPESPPIQRDLALLQMQMRDYAGYVTSRKNMLTQRPGFRQNWTALAIAHHFSGNLTEAENVLTTYEETLKQTPPRTDYEHWEAILYKNFIIAESGDYAKALDHLDAVGKKAPDILGVMEMRAEYLLKLDKKAEAEAAYVALLERNPENSRYYDGWIAAKGLTEANPKDCKRAYDEWVEKYPRGDAARRIPLDFLEDDDFLEAADGYLQRMLKKRIPSTFANVKVLYRDPSKRDNILKLVQGYESGKLDAQANGSTDKQANGDSTGFESAVLYFLAQHYNFHLSRDLPKAMEYIDRAIALSPESVDFHMTKARILKHLGNLPEAAVVMDKARSLDEKDRYINTKCAKYQLRNDENEKALATMSKFTRNETAGGPLGDLHEMQCIWYIVEDGQSYLRQRKLGLALKRLHAAFNIFETWHEDQFDFHNFSLRKGMIRAYVDMLRWEDHLRDHPFFSRLAISAIEAYTLLYDEPDLVHGPLNGLNGAGQDGEADSSERKKALKKAKKEQQKLERAEAEKREALKTSKASKGSDGETKKEDKDPLGKELVETKDPLKDAIKFVNPLLEFNAGNIEAQNAGFEVFLRRRKYLLALKCLLAAHAIDRFSPTLHQQLLRFRHTLNNLPKDTLSPKAAEIIALDFDPLFSKDESLPNWNEAFLEANKASPAHVRAGLEVRSLLDPTSKDRNETQLLKTLELEGAEIEDGIRGLALLREWRSSKEVQGEFRETAHERWKEASIFSSK